MEIDRDKIDSIFYDLKHELITEKQAHQKVLDLFASLPYSIYEEELNKITQLPQTQISLIKQCEILIMFANKLGLYDAADFIRISIH